MRKKSKQSKIDRKKALSIALAVLNGMQTNAPLAVPLVAAAVKEASHREPIGEGMLSLLNRGGQLTERLFFATAYAAGTNTVSSTVTTSQTVIGGDTLVVTSGGTINVAGNNAVDMPGNGGTLINSGTIIGGGSYGIAVSGGSTNAVTVSGGTVTGGMNGAGIYIISGSGNTMTVSGGLVSGGVNGILQCNGTLDTTTIISGTVSGNIGIAVSGGTSETVKVSGGLVSGWNQGILLNGNHSSTVTVAGGLVSGSTIGIDVSDGTANTVTVSGGTVGGTEGILLYGGTLDTATITSGTVSGGVYGILVSGGSANAVTVNGGTVTGGMYGIEVSNGSNNTATINGGTVTGGEAGVYISSGSGNAVTISGGTVTGGTAGFGGIMAANGTSNTFTVDGGTVGGIFGISFINENGDMATVNGGAVSGNIAGIVAGGTSNKVTVAGGTISGDACGISIADTSNTVTVNGGTVSGGEWGITLSGSSNMIMVNGGTITGGTYGIYLPNGTGDMVNVAGGTVMKAMISGTTNVLNVSGSGLVIDAMVDTGAQLNLGGGGTIAYTADNSIANMTAAGGTVMLANGQTVGRSLMIGNLSGSANYVINTDLAHGLSDQIKITSAAGSTANTVQVAYDPAYLTGGSVSGSATFATVSGGSAVFTALPSEYGAYRFTPAIASTTSGTTTTWAVTQLANGNAGGAGGGVSASETVRTGADAFAGGLALWRSENNNLTKRMGDLRNATGKAGMWLRTYRGAEEITDNDGRIIDQQYTALQGGYDHKSNRSDGVVYTGYALGYLSGNSTYNRGNGGANSYSLGVYRSWLGKSGHYLDVIGKLGRLRNTYTSYLNNADNTRVDGGYSTWGASLSAEYGYRKQMKSNWYLEPQSELNYSRINSVSYTDSDGTFIQNRAMNSLIGRLGLAIGREVGSTTYYGKVSLAREFAANAEITAASDNLSPVDYDQNLEDSWLEFAIGLTGKLSSRTDGYLEITRTNGDKVKTPWQFNVGARWNF
jgi:outer membrane autotransporter protein